MFVVDPGVSHRGAMSYGAWLIEAGGGAARVDSARPGAHKLCASGARAA